MPPDLSSTAPGARDWAALPRDVLFDVFLKLGPREIMLGAELACTAWWRVALEEPALWRRIGYHNIREMTWRRPFGADAEMVRATDAEMAMARVALARAAGQCEAFRGDLDYDDLPYLVERAPSLKTLHIEDFSNYDDGNEKLIVALEKLPLLEDFQIHFTQTVERVDEMLQSVCQARSNLKKLVLRFAEAWDLGCNEDDFCREPMDREIPMMHKLRTLTLYDCDLTSKGLMGILDNCPLLESLHITGYFNKREMNEELRLKCGRVKKLTLPTTLNAKDQWYRELIGYSDSEEESEETPGLNRETNLTRKTDLSEAMFECFGTFP
ncbi:hypothetical protein EJB05_09672, partial [Eragrostis curvula]